MGAWGYGLRDNDKAMDVIETKRRQIMKIIREEDKRDLRKLLSNCTSTQVLAIIDFMFENGVQYTFFDNCRAIIDKAIDTEKDSIHDYDNPERRKTILGALKKRLQGKKVDETIFNKVELIGAICNTLENAD